MASVSIIIRARDEAGIIGRTLEAISGQDFSDYEIILVDSGSKDATLEIARRYTTKIVSLRSECFTYGLALNLGARGASGQYLVSLSAHAVPASVFWLSKLLSTMDNTLVAGASSRQIPFPGQMIETYLLFWQALHAMHIRTPVVHRYLFSNASSIFRAELWRENPFDEHLPFCEDHHWAQLVQQQGFQIVYVPDSIVLHSHRMTMMERLRRNRDELRTILGLYR